MNAVLDLFDRPVVPGLAVCDGFVSTAEEAMLVARIDDTGLSPFRFQRWTGKRLTRSYGWSYDFKTGKFAPTEPMPDWLLPLKARAADFAGLAPDDLVQALLIRYDPGSGIGWHKDRPVFEHVIGISLGSQASLRLRRRGDHGFERTKADLPRRSTYHLSGEVRHLWEHSIAPLDVPRWSITFRSLSAKGRRM